MMIITMPRSKSTDLDPPVAVALLFIG